ncbi:MAG: hypothetical protein PHX30_02885 [Candidatus Pacebacteria bacterium]|nr:hypothetical protein [Candidatus Paceibacterota bacterium]
MAKGKFEIYSMRKCFSREEALVALIFLSNLFSEMYWKTKVVEGAVDVWVVGFLERGSLWPRSDAIKLSNIGMSFVTPGDEADIAGFAKSNGMTFLNNRYIIDEKKKRECFGKEIDSQLAICGSLETKSAELSIGVIP